MKTQNLKVKGNIIAIHGNGFFRVKVPEFPTDTMCMLASKISKGSDKPVLNDEVVIEVSPTDMTKGRIIMKR